MNEPQRQAYLKALGLTPWVAAEPLPGAAPTPALDWPEIDNSAAAVTAPANEAPPAASEASAAIPDTARAAVDNLSTPAAETKANASQAPAPEPAREKVAPATRITVQAHQVGDIWVLAEQEDAGAPDLGREALQLLQNLLAVFPGERRGARRFLWPLSDVTQGDDALQKTFLSFARGLGGRILLCAGEDSCRKLLGSERYQLLQAPVPVLPVSALTEMLADPVDHKRASWQAMLAAGFHG